MKKRRNYFIQFIYFFLYLWSLEGLCITFNIRQCEVRNLVERNEYKISHSGTKNTHTPPWEHTDQRIKEVKIQKGTIYIAHCLTSGEGESNLPLWMWNFIIMFLEVFAHLYIRVTVCWKFVNSGYDLCDTEERSSQKMHWKKFSKNVLRCLLLDQRDNGPVEKHRKFRLYIWDWIKRRTIPVTDNYYLLTLLLVLLHAYCIIHAERRLSNNLY